MTRHESHKPTHLNCPVIIYLCVGLFMGFVDSRKQLELSDAGGDIIVVTIFRTVRTFGVYVAFLNVCNWSPVCVSNPLYWDQCTCSSIWRDLLCYVTV